MNEGLKLIDRAMLAKKKKRKEKKKKEIVTYMFPTTQPQIVGSSSAGSVCSSC